MWELVFHKLCEIDQLFFSWKKKKKNENFKAEITAVCSFFYKEEAGRENLIELLPLIKFSHNPEKDSIISDHAYFIYKEAIQTLMLPKYMIY